MPRPFTPISTIPSCPLSLIQILNGVYYYEVGDCETGAVTGWTTSMAQLTVGCNGGKCNSTGGAFAPVAVPIPNKRRPKPPGTSGQKREAAKTQATQFFRRTKVSSSRKVQGYIAATEGGDGASWFVWAADNPAALASDWAAAAAELALSQANVGTPNEVEVKYPVTPEGPNKKRRVTQSIRCIDLLPQPKIISLVDTPLINSIVVEAWQFLTKDDRPVVLKLKADAPDVDAIDVGSTSTRYFRVFEMQLRPDPNVKRVASKLYFGQEISDKEVEANAADLLIQEDGIVLVDAHEFSAVLEYEHTAGRIQVHCSTVEPLVPDSDYV